MSATPSNAMAAVGGAAVTAPIGSNFRAFCGEFNPLTPTQQVLVQELARRAMQMTDYDWALRVVQAEVAHATAKVLDGHDDTSRELARAAALGNEKAEAIQRQGLRATRGFTAALSALQRLQAQNANALSEVLSLPDPRFASEASCQLWLVRRFREGLQPCRGCGQRGQGSVIAARRCWECPVCKCQTGMRHATVMQTSRLPLAVWFAAIRIVLLRPSMSASQLSSLLQIPRVQTVRGMARKIYVAMHSDTPSVRLAGLDEVYLPTA